MLLRIALAAALTLSASGAALAQNNAGTYLAGRQAVLENDYGAAASYLSRALDRDPGNPILMDALIGSLVRKGEVARAETVARQFLQTGAQSQVANLVLMAGNAKSGDWDGLLADLDAGQSVGPLFNNLARAWSLIGAGRTQDALAAFDEVAAERGVEAFGLYHKALALASLDRFEEAAAILDEDELRLTTRGVRARAQILSQLGRNEEALSVIADAYGPDLDPVMQDTRDRLGAGETLTFDVAPDARAGFAELAFSISNALSNEVSNDYTLLYSRVVQDLQPDHVEATLLSAALLDQLGQYKLSIDTYRRIPRESPAFDAAELGRAEVLRESGHDEAAIEVMQQLSEIRPDLPIIHITLGDTLRELGRFEEARAAYDAAIALFDQDVEAQWPIYFSRAITEERLGDWDAAEADFRKALELEPEQPQVLNYLGYSYVERREKLDEALAMIEKAVAARPDSGYIADSLGWVFYRLGRYDEAVEPMETAVELMPTDPVVNDHLGDVYWAVGRKLEARFQWQRALSFAEDDTDDATDDFDPERVRSKLEVGLDQVLEDEGSAPLKIANEG